MSTPDDFESEGGDKAATASKTPKYYQVAVPSFGLNATTAPGDSFVRLGSFPAFATTEASLPGFPNSLALAKLVGDPTLIAAVEEKTEDVVTTTFTDGGGLLSTATSSYGGTGDSNFLLGFADDTRKRGPTTGNTLDPPTLSNGATVANTIAARQAETATLLTKGGWWDHSDGNRVTTTSGDKIEVIQGNYKLVVLGRQPVPTAPAAGATKADIYNAYSTLVGNAFITDVSGGHFQEQYPSPTPCIKTVEYTQDSGGEWTLYQDNSVGRLITKLKGQTVDLFEGSKRETYVGSSGAATDGTGSLDPEIISKTWARRVYAQTGSEDKPVAGDVTSYTYASSIFSQVGSEKAPIGGSTTNVDGKLSAGIGDEASSGDVTSKTWAQRIRSYTGSASKPVVHMFSSTYALEIESYTFATSIISTNMALNNLDMTVGIKESVQVGLAVEMFLGKKVAFVLDHTEIAATATKVRAEKKAIAASQLTLAEIQNKISMVSFALAQENTLMADASTVIGEAVALLAEATLIA